VLTGCVWRGSDALRGFAFIQFEEPDDAKQAMDNMHESELYGRVLTVNIAKPQAASYNRAGMCVCVCGRDASNTGWCEIHLLMRHYSIA
jgi:RNA recognition motif-containing protein